MSLTDLIRKSEPLPVATAIPATRATDSGAQQGNVAVIATVAVAKAKAQEPEPVEARTDAAAPHVARWPGAHTDGGDGTAFALRVQRFTERGMSESDAADLAGRLSLRDQDGDDRRICLECSHLGSSGRCIAAATGRLPGSSPRLAPVQTILQRCEGFGLRKGLC